MKVLFGICSWGLGHATRDIPLIKRMLEEGHTLTLCGKGRSLELLKKEFKKKCLYLNIPDYSSPYSKRNFFIPKFVAYVPFYINEIIEEHKRIKKLIYKERYERIISDNRFGVYSKEIPSYFISHQLRFIVPGRIKPFERVTERFNYLFKNNFCKFLVPDDRESCLSGELSHNLNYFEKDRIEYLGIISDLKKRDVKEDIDYFISISGPEPQRTIFERRVLAQAPFLRGKVVIALGKPENEKEIVDNHLHIFGFLERERQEEIMNRAKLVITRPGYTTVMELAILGKKALFIPTPGQTEQVYLASYHEKKGNFYSVEQDKLNLREDVEKAKEYKGITCSSLKENGVDKFMRIVFKEK
ncbi:MAG: glycosyltransferase [Candidatus Aerophobetes bacterium]|nr:glycosyltransferase [Candidatus Aerophobetes bacterium]